MGRSERAVVVKTTRITIETESLLVVRRGKTIVTWCPACCAEVEAMTIEGDKPWRRDPFCPLKRVARHRQAPFLGPRRRSGPALPSVAAPVLCIRGRSQFPGPEANGPENRRRTMKSIPFAPKWPRIARLSLALATVAGPVYALAQSTASQRYTVVDLGPVGPSSSPGQPYYGQRQWAGQWRDCPRESQQSGESVSHAVLWEGTSLKDISSPGLGGPNSAAYGVNVWGQVVGQADTKTPDPNGEDFCGSKALALTQSGNTCVPFLWQHGSMIALPRLRNSAGKEGSNGVALQVNDFGIAAGTAENGELDSTCPGASTSAQRIEFKPVIWTRPFPGSKVQELHTVDGDPDGIAFAINKLGQAVGGTGTCGPFNAIELNNLISLHAVLWQNSKAIDLGNLGGDGKSFGIFAYRPERLRAGCGSFRHRRRRELSCLLLAAGPHHRSRNSER